MGDKLKFLVDECCDAGLVRLLRDHGHDVSYVLEEQPGVSDDDVLLRAFNQGRILLTEDKDFGELVYRLKKPSKGIILVRMTVGERNQKWQRLEKLIENYGDRLPGHFVVVDSQKFRFRPLLFLVQDH
jgi:predicted nuclease of predicted toxin-antitoxin system